MVIAGPTASGKSEAGRIVAAASGGAVVNADALQLYRDLKILSARPDAGPEDNPPHWLYGIQDGAIPFSAGAFSRLASETIEALWRDDRIPVLVGGAGLYLRALLEGLSPIPDIAPSWRQEAKARLSQTGAAAFYDEVYALDPEAVSNIDPHDPQRLIRVWEVSRATGEPLSAWRRRPRVAALPKCEITAFVTLPERELLYQRCDVRFETMMAEGAMAEIDVLASRRLPNTAPVMKAVGVPPLLRFRAGLCREEEAVAEAQRDTRRYAKRQMTWFRGQTSRWLEIHGRTPHEFADRILARLARGAEGGA